MDGDFANRQGKFAVESFFWRRVIDWSVDHIPAIFHRPLIWIAAFVFFFIAAPARKALLRNLRLVLPRSWRALNYPRVIRVFANFGWSLTDSAAYRMSKARVRYEVEGTRLLERLTSSKGGIVLTAHMGNYDLGAALFAWHQYLGQPRKADNKCDSQQGSYLGPSFSSEEIRSYLQSQNIPFMELAEEEIPRLITE